MSEVAVEVESGDETTETQEAPKRYILLETDGVNVQFKGDMLVLEAIKAVEQFHAYLLGVQQRAAQPAQAAPLECPVDESVPD